MMLLSDYHYFSPVILYSALFNNSHIVFDIFETHQKASFSNRCMLASPLGAVNLSIPLRGGRNLRSTVGELKIDYRQRWQDQHFKTIKNYYNRSPWFEFYRSDVEHLLQQRPERLVDFNRLCFNWAIAKLGVAVKMSETDAPSWVPPEGPVSDWRRRLLPKNYTTVHTTLGFPEVPRYVQVYQEKAGFLPNLSILDLLFCCGPQSAEVLRRVWA